MVFYIVFSVEHIDSFRKSDSYACINKIYSDKEKAFEFALRKQLSYIDLLDLSFDVENDGKKLFMYLTDDEKNFEDRLSFFHINKKKIFPKPKFSAQSSNTSVFVKQITELDDEKFKIDIQEIKDLCE
jgi:hypothetical protein